MLAVAEELPYAALCFDVWSTEEVEGTGQVRVMACFEDEGDGYSYIAGRTSTQMQGSNMFCIRWTAASNC